MFIPLLVFACVILYRTVDDNLGIGWPHNVIRNWEHYGLLQLKGGLVVNPGGYEALSHPHYYPGHRAASLYPAFALSRAFAWTGTGLLPFFVALSLMIFISVWWLMGRSGLALLTAGVASLSPGLYPFTALLDPNTMAALAGLPFAAVVFSLLRLTRLSARAIGALILLIAAYSSINWSSALVHGAVVAALVVSRSIEWRRLVLYLGLAGGSALLVVAFAVIQKQGQSANFADFLAAYAWGNTGYGEGLTTGRALVRLAAVNALGLLPLLALCVYLMARRFRFGDSRMWLGMLPLVTTLLEIGVLRNYFGHHPWMACPLVLAGVILSLWVWMDPSREQGAVRAAAFSFPVPRSILTVLGLLTAVFCFAWAVLFFYRSRQENVMPLITLVRVHTERSDTLVIESHRDPNLTREVSRLEQALDRHIEVVDTLGAGFRSGGNALLLTASESGVGGSLAGRSSEHRMKSLPWVDRLLVWYDRSISRRRAGDRIELSPDYFLYEVKLNGGLQNLN